VRVGSPFGKADVGRRQGGTLAGGFAVTDPAPTVTAIAPSSGVSGDVVSVTDLAGTGFLAGATVKLQKAGETDISAGSVAVVSADRITCELDLAGAATGGWDVVVTNTDGQSAALAGGFAVTDPAPTVTSITPSSGVNNANKDVTIAGTGFLIGAAVKLHTGLSDINATSVTVADSNTITCTLPITGATAGAWDVVVTNPDGQADSLAGGFTITAAPTEYTIVQGSGYFLNRGLAINRCSFKFRCNSTLGTGSLTYMDFGTRRAVTATVKGATLNNNGTGPQAVISWLTATGVEYTTTVDATAKSFRITGPSYSAETPAGTQVTGDITITTSLTP